MDQNLARHTGKEENNTTAAPKRYVGLVDHTLAQGEVCVGQVGQGLQQDLGRHVGLEVCWVELVPVTCFQASKK